MKKSISVGISFGITSAVITTLGLMIGLDSSTGSKLVVIGGILTIAIADAFSDSLGIHISEESIKKPERSIWESTLSTFIAKLFVGLTFLIPVLTIKNLQTAIFTNIVWGLILVSLLSYYIAKNEKKSVLHVVGEHVSITIIVIFISYFIGYFIKLYFG